MYLFSCYSHGYLIATWMMCSIIHIDFSITSGIKVLGLSFIQSFVYMAFALLLAYSVPAKRCSHYRVLYLRSHIRMAIHVA